MKEFAAPESLAATSHRIRHAGWWKCLGVGVITLVGVTGCADRNKNDVPESPATSGEISNSVSKAGEKVENAAEKVGDVASGAATTGKVKSAIVANKTIDSTKINVDTKDEGNNKIVYLRGTVANEAQSKLVVAIAKKNAPGYSINNLLTVAGKAPAAKAPAPKAPGAKAP